MELSNLHDTQHAEIAILGAMLQDPLAVLDTVSAVRAEDFALDSHQRIFRTMQGMARDGEAVDMLTVFEKLKRRGESDAVGGAGYLADLSSGVPRGMNVGGWLRIVQDAALARRGVKVLQDAVQRLAARTESPTVVLDELTRTLAQERPDDTQTAADVVPRAMQRLEAGDYLVMSTGVTDLDLMLHGGFRTKELAVIGAQPSAGKSALCRQAERAAMQLFLDSAEHMQCQPFGVHAFSIEVSDEQWMLKHTAHVAGIPAWKLREPTLMSAVDKDSMRKAAMKICQWPYRIDDAGGLTIDSLLAKARISAIRHNTKLITVDYLQLLIQDERNTAREMGNIARRLKQFAKDYDCAVVALSQLKRAGDINKRPTVQDLKESGDIEAAADVVLLNFRPKNPDDGRYTGEDELIVGKQRDGAVGALDMWFDVETLCFESRRA